MKQYEFGITDNRSGQNYSVCVTARTVAIARVQLARHYQAYTMNPTPIAARVPHEVFGELNCADCTEAD